MKRIGIIFHPKRDQAVTYTAELEKFLIGRGVSVWKCSSWEEDCVRTYAAGSDAVISVGGDGTILRAARAIGGQPIPILGINLGKLGFLTELSAAEAMSKLPGLLNGGGWIEKRAFLEAEVTNHSGRFIALNDVVVARAGSVRLISVEVTVDGERLASYRADGVIVASATGSTGYNLAAGGPILPPEAREMVIKPISPHFSLDQALVLPPATNVRLRMSAAHEAVVSIDGQVEFPLKSGEEVKAHSSDATCLLLRSRPRSYFYNSLEQVLKGKAL